MKSVSTEPPRAMCLRPEKKIGWKLIFHPSSGDIPVLTFPTPCLVDLLSRPFSLTRIEGKRANSILNLHISLPRVQQGDVQRGRRRLVWHRASSLFFLLCLQRVPPTSSQPPLDQEQRRRTFISFHQFPNFPFSLTSRANDTKSQRGGNDDQQLYGLPSDLGEIREHSRSSVFL